MSDSEHRALTRSVNVGEGAMLERLIESNVRSLHLARRLMRAQQVADVERMLADRAIDRAVADGGDPDAIDAAVAAVRSAELAEEHEDGLSHRWAMHRCEVARLTQSARLLVRGSTFPRLEQDPE